MRIQRFWGSSAVGLVALCAFAVAQPTETATGSTGEDTQPAATRDLSSPIPLDPAVIVGQTDSGVRYYIRRNERPLERAELRLVVASGSLQEDEKQLGLAHFVEHMAFNGTEHFDKNEVIEYMRSIGMSFGAGVNAYTTFDRTVYRLQVPTDDEEALDKGLLILEDWASGLTFDGEEIDRERGVVLEEWRSGRGAAARVRDQHLPVLLAGSRRAERIPIGDPDLLQTFPHEDLVRYYRTWYRPERMAILAVGDFEPERMQRKIEKQFKKLGTKNRPATAPPAEVEDKVGLKIGDRFSVATDPEIQRTRLERMVRHRAPRGTSLGDFRDDLVDTLFLQMFNQRLGELLQQAKPPFLSAGAGLQRIDQFTLMFVLALTPHEGELLAGTEALMLEAERVRRHGFVESELERQRTDLLRTFERRWEERETTNSSAFVNPLLSHFLDAQSYPDAAQELEMAREFLPGIELAEVNQRASRWAKGEDRVTLVTAPSSQEDSLPTEEAIREVFDKVRTTTVEPWVDEVSDSPLIEEPPSPGTITSREHLEDLDVHHWTLGNGIELYLKVTDFKKDEVLVSAFSPGGTSLVSDELYESAEMANTILGLSGVGEHSLIELSKLLTGKVMRISPVLSESTEGFQGGGSPADLEPLFQMLYLQATAPRRDPEAFASFQNRLGGLIRNRRANPEVVFSETIEEVMFQGHPRRQPLDENFLELVDHEEAMTVFRDRFADFSDFTFLIVGAFDLEVIEPLVLRYMASLPSTNRTEEPRDLGIRTASGKVGEEVHMGLEEKAQVQLLLSGDFEQRVEERLLLQVMVDVLRARLRDRVREELGGTYGVRISANTSHWPLQRYQIAVSFGADPQRIDELIAVVNQEMDQLQKGPVSQEELDKVLETQRRSRETSLRQNGFWIGSLAYALEHGEELAQILTFEDRLSAVDTDSVSRAAKKYLSRENVGQFVLRPEKAQQEEDDGASEDSLEPSESAEPEG